MPAEFIPRTTVAQPTTTQSFLSRLQAGPTPISQHTSGLTPGSTVSVTAPPPLAPNPDYEGSIAKLNDIVGNQQALTQQVQQQASTNDFLKNLTQEYSKALSRLNGLQGAGVAGSPTPVGSTPVATEGGPHQVEQWINQALGILGLGKRFEPGIMNMIMHESSGNPNSVNNWDSNAKAGHPSQGLMQTIPGTFAEYALPGYNKNILDPVSNIIAGVRYALKNYGKGMVLAGGRHYPSGKYEGY